MPRPRWSMILAPQPYSFWRARISRPIDQSASGEQRNRYGKIPISVPLLPGPQLGENDIRADCKLIVFHWEPYCGNPYGTALVVLLIKNYRTDKKRGATPAPLIPGNTSSLPYTASSPCRFRIS